MQTIKSDTVSLRINDKIKKSLEGECEEKGIAFNKLLCQVLTRHVRWYTMAEKMDMITMPKTAYKAYTDEIPDDKIKKIARTSGKESFRNYTLLNTSEFTTKSFLETLDLWLTINHISFEHDITNNDAHEFVIRHDLGEKFSILLNEIVNDLVEELDRKYTNLNSTDENLTFVIGTGAYDSNSDAL